MLAQGWVQRNLADWYLGLNGRARFRRRSQPPEPAEVWQALPGVQASRGAARNAGDVLSEDDRASRAL
jgi:hypothetical protein